MNESGIVRPVEGKWFLVNPAKLDFNFLDAPRRNTKEEETRILITDAMHELEKYPEKYNSPFRTLVPICKVSTAKVINDFRRFSQNSGDGIADWVHQALEWAQRINNGESWNDICIKPDRMRCYRLIEWKNGFIRFVGGTNLGSFKCAATAVGKTDWKMKDKVFYAVPLIVKYD